MIDLETAKKLVTTEINKAYRGELAPLVIIDEQTIEKEYGWVFFYQTQKFAETRDFHYSLAGNGPLIVEKANGALHKFGTAQNPEETIREFELSKSLGSSKR